MKLLHCISIHVSQVKNLIDFIDLEVKVGHLNLVKKVTGNTCMRVKPTVQLLLKILPVTSAWKNSRLSIFS